MPHPPRRRLRLLASAVVVLGVPSSAAATDLTARATPLMLVGAPAAKGCPTAGQVTGDDLIVRARSLAARPTAVGSTNSVAITRIVDAWLKAPAPVLSVCDAPTARAGRPLGPILGTVAVAPWSDGVAAGRRQLGNSHLSAAAAAKPGDRFVLPAGVSTDAAVDVAVATPGGVRTIRPVLPGGGPTSVAVEGTPAAPEVVVTGASGTTTRQAVPAAPPLALSVKPRKPRSQDRTARATFAVSAAPGSIIVGLKVTPLFDVQGHAAGAWTKDGAGPAFAATRTTAAVTLTVGGVEDETSAIDVVAIQPLQRVFSSVTCRLGRRGNSRRRIAAMRCKPDDLAPLARWFGRSPAAVEAERAGAPDRRSGLVRPSFVLLVEDGMDTNAIERLRAVARREAPVGLPLATPRGGPPSASQIETTKARHAAPATRAAAAAPDVPARASVIASLAGSSAATAQADLGAASSYGVEAGDLNGDGRPDYVIGSERTQVWMSAPGGLYREVAYDTGDATLQDPQSDSELSTYVDALTRTREPGFIGDLDGDGTAELVSPRGDITLGQRAWASATPVSLTPGAAGPGQPSTTTDTDHSADLVPLPDTTGDGRPELLEIGRDVRAVIASEAFVPGGNARLPVLLETPAANVLDPVIERLQEEGRVGYVGYVPTRPAVDATSQQRAAVLLGPIDQPNYGGDDHWFDPPARTSIVWQTIDASLPSGLAPMSAPFKVSSDVTVVDSDGATGDLLVRATPVSSCYSELGECSRISRFRRDGTLRATFDVTGADTDNCVFVDDGPDPDSESDVLCATGMGDALPDAFGTRNGYGRAVVLGSSALTGVVTTASLPHVTFAGHAITSASGLTSMVTPNGHRVVSTVDVTGRGRAARGTMVVIDGIGA